MRSTPRLFLLSGCLAASLFLGTPHAAHAVGQCSTAAFGAGGGSTPCCASSAMAGGGVCYAPADQSFQFTIKSIGFEKQDGTVVTLGSNKLFNASTADAGNVIGDFISGGQLPAGTYVAVRAAVSLTATTANSAVTTLDGRSCTAGAVTGSFEQPMGGFPVCATGEPNAGTDSCLDPGNHDTFLYRNTGAGTFAYDGSSPFSLSFTFNTGNGVHCDFTPGAGGTQSAKSPGLLIVTIARGS